MKYIPVTPSLSQASYYASHVPGSWKPPEELKDDIGCAKEDVNILERTNTGLPWGAESQQELTLPKYYL